MSDKYTIWGKQLIDPNSYAQMDAAMSIEPAVAGALMPDAHVGYGLPIGGVLGLDNAVCPYAVGVDIACRMKMSIFEIDPAELDRIKKSFITILRRNTMFGMGVENQRDYDHPILEDIKRSNLTPIVENRERAIKQIGTSGTGNHFVEFGVITLPKTAEQTTEPWATGTKSYFRELEEGSYVAVMSHSGSRGVGAKVCKHYTDIAKALHPELQDDPLRRDLAWLDMDSEPGQEYWEAMNLMGEYARANHDLIHTSISENLGIKPAVQIENHHNFAWKEMHNGRELIVHRKGATPAGVGVLGVIPGSMGTPAYIVRGRGFAASLNSASHGAGRQLGRKAADKVNKPRYREMLDALTARGITVLSCGADELCNVYKNIDEVMACQTELVDTVGRFDPRIVRMAGGGERAED